MANKPEDICVSFETAKALHDAGIVVESLYSWFSFKGIAELKLTEYKKQVNDYVYKIYPAPTAEEIELPDYVVNNNIKAFLRINKALHHWRVNYYDYLGWSLIDYDKLDPFPDDHKLCEVMAYVKMCLKEAGYV